MLNTNYVLINFSQKQIKIFFKITSFKICTNSILIIICRREQMLNTSSREAYEIITLQQGSGTVGELIQALDISAIKNCKAKQIWIDFTDTIGLGT